MDICVLPWPSGVSCDDKSTVCLPTCNDPSRDVKLGDGAGERAGSHSNPAQDSAKHDRRSAAKLLHQHATKGTCGTDLMLLV